VWSSYSNSESKAIPEGKKINRTKIQGVFFILLSLLIVTVSALVYESALQTVSQTIQDVAGSFTVTSPALGTIDELDTRSYTKGEVAALGNAISITTAKDNVYLHFNATFCRRDSRHNDHRISRLWSYQFGQSWSMDFRL
jgi:hypothetical protein